MRRSSLTITRAMVAMLLLATTMAIAAPSEAVPIEPGAVFDDFEDNDAGDWTFFGGSDAGGGGGIAADRPKEGEYYLSTGWGGEGTASGFYGGTFKNLDDGAQVAVPAEPWFNVWVYPQSDTTVDQYTLELTLREDTDGDGWSDGSEDSIGLNTVLASTDFNDEWMLISAPLSAFTDRGTGGNGIFEGNLDEVVIVFGGVQGGSGSVIEVDFDQLAFTSGGPADIDPGPGDGTTIDDFQAGLPDGVDGDGIDIGFYTFQGAGSSITLANPATPPAPAIPDTGSSNSVLQLDIDSSSFAGMIHGFENDAVDTWVSQDWSTSEGISLWFHGTNSGAELFLDILDNRNSGSTTDDAERFTTTFVDDTAGWQLLEFPFASFARKEIGNGAPADGLGLFQMHGWAFGTLGTDGPRTFYIDDVALYGAAQPPAVSVGFASTVTTIVEGATGQVGVRLNRPLGPEDPAEVTVDYRTEPAAAVPGTEYTPASGTLTFVRGGPSELTFDVQTFDDTKFEGLERIVTRLSNPVGVEGGGQGSILIEDNDPFDSDLIDDFEAGAYLWDDGGLVDVDAVSLGSGTGNERPGQDIIEQAMSLTTSGASADFRQAKRNVLADLEALLPVSSTPVARRVTLAIQRLQRALTPDYWLSGSTLHPDHGAKVFAAERQAMLQLRVVANGRTIESGTATAAIDSLLAIDAGLAASAIEVAERNGADQGRLTRARREVGRAEADARNGRPDRAVARYSLAWGQANSALERLEREGVDLSLGAVMRDFPVGQDWTDVETLDFWFDGTGSGEEVTVLLKDNRAPDPGPSGWEMVWSDEFDEPAGSSPNPDNWTNEIGDVTPDGKNGWGNDELQYYTDDPSNAATDGDGNLVITLREADGSLDCYYGPCQYTSARLLSWQKAEFAYGRIESRLKVPQGAGVWPAFWSLGTDIDRNPWPGAGEIDIMEFVGREPNEIFGTIHGPGYSGGASFGGIYDFGSPVFDGYHTFTVEWEPNLITWYVDGIQYHQASPADVAPNEWVFDKPFFLLLNLAIGGNFGGPVGEETTFPQSYAIDYVRVYQGPDSGERFEATFVDDAEGWKQVSVPIGDFVRSDDQPAGAPDDGLGLDQVRGYGFELPAVAGTYLVDHVRTVPIPPPAQLTVTTAADSGPGSLRDALARIAAGGTVDFDAALAGQTITLTSGQLVVPRNLTIDASSASGVIVSGGDTSRVFEVAAGASVAMNDLVIRDGLASPQGGGVLNNGDLTLERVVVTDNVENSAGPANFQFGGGGIYNGDSATLNLVDSEVSNNLATNHPGGGVYGFFNSTVTVTGSTVTGNVSGDVAGGFRSLGDTEILNSTISGNTSTTWHGGGIFHTDGQLTVTNSTVTANTAPAGTASGIVVATFGSPAVMTLTNSIIEGDGGAFACATEGGGAATIVSGGGNIDNDNSCQLTGDGDQPTTDALLGPLADNGGRTQTHGLGAESPAIDAAQGGSCPATDQRGVSRPQGAGCDVGSVEVEAS